VAKAQDKDIGMNKLAGKRTIAYYRCDIHDQSDAAILKQQKRIWRWARDNGVKIVAEFAEHGASKIPGKSAR